MKGDLFSPCIRLEREGRSRVIRALKAGVIEADDGRKNRPSYIYIMNWEHLKF